MTSFGKTMWCIAGGHIPFPSVGREPECTSRDTLCFVNVSDMPANASLQFYYSDREPVGPYRLTIDARRCRHVRVNDLIDPEAVSLDVPYGLLIESDVPIVVHLLRHDTSAGNLAISSVAASHA